MRQSRKKWERKREEQRNKVIALLFIVMMVIFCVVNIATADRGFSAKKTGHWNRDRSLRFPVLKAEDG